MLRAYIYILESEGSWKDHFPLIKFYFNNNYHASIRMALYEELYEMERRSPLCWTEVGDKGILGFEMIHNTT